MNPYKSLLTSLTQSYAVSGYEWELGITETIQKHIGYTGKRIGDNLVYQFGSGTKKIFLSAHMDEVGFFITQVQKDFVKILPIGDIEIDDVIGNRLLFFQNQKSMVSNKIQKAKSFADLKVYGLKNPEIGNVGTFEKTTSYNNQTIEATGLDNKVSCAALIETIKTLQNTKLNKTVFICFACREEVGVNGLMQAVKKIDPDVCIDIDSAYALPVTNPQKKANWHIPQIGKGPAIQLMGNGFIIKAENRRLIESICKKQNISYQYEIPEGDSGGTNARSLINAGYETIQINIPVAKQHTSKSKASLTDIARTTKLIKNLLSAI
jgi:endoglucanase